MADEPSIHETLPDSLQRTIDKRLTAGEATLMSLCGANGEGLVVTDRRLVILREQMPIAGESVIDCFEYPYEQVRTVRIDSAVGGGHLLLDLVTPPLDDKEVTLFFPSYDQSKFDAAAARIRMLVENSRAVSLSGPAMEETPILCAACGAEIADPSWSHCTECGASRGLICRMCMNLLPAGAKHCPQCGAPAALAFSSICSGCGGTVASTFSYCPHCGNGRNLRCARCGGPALPNWTRCATCGQPLDASVGVSPAVMGAPPVGMRASAPADSPLAAEEHNARGMNLYSQERYDDAIRAFRQALDLAPVNALYHCNLGVALAEIGRDEEALREYDTAIRLSPENPTAYLNLGYFHSEREHDEEARAAWNRAVEVAPNSPEADEARQNLAHAEDV